jgi:hypothetical protein
MDLGRCFMTVHLEMIVELAHRTQKPLSLRNGLKPHHFSIFRLNAK